MNKILLLLEQKENSRLLSEVLANNYQVYLPSEVSSHTIIDVLDKPFDLCIFDSLVLKKYQQNFQFRRKEEEPVFLPFIMLVNSQYVRMITPYLQQQNIDEVIVTPIEKIELLFKIEILLRMRELSLQLKAALEKEQLLKKQLELANNKLQRLATIDGLTKVANRRCFDIHIIKEWKRGKRQREPLFLLLCDVDFFKIYNDTYGHQQGDECLKIVAKVLSQNAKRPGDLVARYGGEEFALILPNTSAVGAVHVAKLIQSDLNSRGIIHQGSKVSEFVTLSIGIAGMIPDINLSTEKLIKVADEALYEAKKKGRNLIVIKEVKAGKDD